VIGGGIFINTIGGAANTDTGSVVAIIVDWIIRKRRRRMR